MIYMFVVDMLQALVLEMCDETEVAVLQLKASFNFTVIININLSLRLLRSPVHVIKTNNIGAYVAYLN